MDIRSTVMESVHGNKLEHITRVMRGKKSRLSNATGGYNYKTYTRGFHRDLIMGISQMYDLEHEDSWKILAYWGRHNCWTEFSNMVVI